MRTQGDGIRPGNRRGALQPFPLLFSRKSRVSPGSRRRAPARLPSARGGRGRQAAPPSFSLLKTRAKPFPPGSCDPERASAAPSAAAPTPALAHQRPERNSRGVKKGPAFERQRRKMAATTGSGERGRRACWRTGRGLLGLVLVLAEAMVAGPGLRAVPAAAFGCAARPGTIRRRPEARAGAAGPWAVRPSRRLGRLRGRGVGERPAEGPSVLGNAGARSRWELARATGSRGCLAWGRGRNPREHRRRRSLAGRRRGRLAPASI